MFEFKQILILENERIEDFYPFSILHCLWELRTGAIRQFERIQKLFSEAEIIFKGRELHTQSFLERFAIENKTIINENLLIIDSTIIFNLTLRNTIEKYIIENPDLDIIFKSKNQVIIKYISSNAIEKSQNLFEITTDNNFLMVDLDNIKQINYLWDALDFVGDEINNDISLFNHRSFSLFEGVYFINQQNIQIGENVSIMPNCVIDGSQGKIIIDDNVTIMAQSTIVGPCYIGKNSIIKIGAKIYPNTSIGEFCKIGGEVENSIFQSYSNKQHEGFLGHSYICEWVNLGADTNNSDLKNTYSEIKMRLPHKTVKTGRIFLGLMCGDHTKTAINTQFNTGTVTGICCVLFESGFLSTTIPSFCWGGSLNSKKYNIEEAIETAKKVMARRNKEMTSSELLLIKNNYTLS